MYVRMHKRRKTRSNNYDSNRRPTPTDLVKKQGPTINKSLVFYLKAIRWRQWRSTIIPKWKSAKFRFWGWSYNLCTFFSDLIRVGLKLQKPNVTWGLQLLYVSALSFLIHSKMELTSMKSHFKIDRNFHCFLLCFDGFWLTFDGFWSEFRWILGWFSIDFEVRFSWCLNVLLKICW